MVDGRRKGRGVRTLLPAVCDTARCMTIYHTRFRREDTGSPAADTEVLTPSRKRGRPAGGLARCKKNLRFRNGSNLNRAR